MIKLSTGLVRQLECAGTGRWRRKGGWFRVELQPFCRAKIIAKKIRILLTTEPVALESPQLVDTKSVSED